MIELNENTVEAWLDDAEKFTYDFMRYSVCCVRTVGVEPTFSRQVLYEAHKEWVETCTDWKNHRFHYGVESLSYTKIFAILLHCLSKRTFVTAMEEHVANDHRSEFEFNGSPQERAEAAQDFLGAPDVICALDFSIQVLCFYEVHRLGRREKFDPRLTESVRHDLIHFLVGSEPHSALSVYMAIKPIFSRD